MTTSHILKEAKSLREGFKGNYFKALILTTLIVVVYNFILFSIGFLLGYNTSNGIFLSAILDLLDTFLLSPLIIFPIQFGLTLLALDRAQNKPFELKRLFKPLNKKWRLLLFQYAIMLVVFAGMLFTALFAIPAYFISKEFLPAVAVGLIALLVPLYYLFTLSYFSGLMIYKTDIDILDALKTSHKVVQSNLKSITWFVTVVFLQVLASALLLFIPLIWILPKVSIAYGLLYDRLCNEASGEDHTEVTTAI